MLIYRASQGRIYQENYILFRDRTHRMPIETAAAERAHAARIEGEFVREAGSTRIERRRPIAAVGTDIVEVVVVAKARSGQEDALVVRLTRKLSTFNAVQCCPF